MKSTGLLMARLACASTKGRRRLVWISRVHGMVVHGWLGTRALLGLPVRSQILICSVWTACHSYNQVNKDTYTAAVYTTHSAEKIPFPSPNMNRAQLCHAATRAFDEPAVRAALPGVDVYPGLASLAPLPP